MHIIIERNIATSFILKWIHRTDSNHVRFEYNDIHYNRAPPYYRSRISIWIFHSVRK